MKIEQEKTRLSALLVVPQSLTITPGYPWRSELGWQWPSAAGAPDHVCQGQVSHIHFLPSAFLSHQPYVIPNVLGIFFFPPSCSSIILDGKQSSSF